MTRPTGSSKYGTTRKNTVMNRAHKIVYGHSQVNMKRNVFVLAIEFFKVS